MQNIKDACGIGQVSEALINWVYMNCIFKALD